MNLILFRKDFAYKSDKFFQFLILLAFMLSSCGSKKSVEDVIETQENKHPPYCDTTHQDNIRNYRLYHYMFFTGNPKDDFSGEDKYNEILFDNNDRLLMQMDTVLEYSTPSHYYNVSLKKENVTVSVWKWKDMPDDTKPPIVMHGYQKDGFIYIEDEQGEYEMCYKIVLGKCLFVWMPHTGWASIPCGRKGRMR